MATPEMFRTLINVSVHMLCHERYTFTVELNGEGRGGDRYIIIYVLYFRNDTVSVEGNRDLAAGCKGIASLGITSSG